MKYSDVGFRAVYHSFVMIKNDEASLRAIADFPGAQDANAVLTYGYYDREQGITLEALGAAIAGDKGFRYLKGPDDVSVKIRMETIDSAELEVCVDIDGNLTRTFADRIAALKAYDAADEVEETRKMTFLDSCRNKYYIDDILVQLLKEGLRPEGCWVRITGLADHYFIGTLLNEPIQDFRWHRGETISFFLRENEK